MEDCEMDEWQAVIEKELSDRRDREKKNMSLGSEELKLQREIRVEQNAEREERKKKSSAQLELMSALAKKMTWLLDSI